MQDLSPYIEIIGRSDAGMVRNHNEDSIAFDAKVGLAILADGMGGYKAGEVASGIATNLLLSEVREDLERSAPYLMDAESGELTSFRIIKDRIEQVNGAIFNTAQSQPQCEGMGTTLVLAMYYDNRMTVAHIGDSRMYRFRAGEFSQVTRDHSLLQEQLDSGLITPEQAKQSQNKNLVTRALGIDPTVQPELHEYPVEPGDIYLVCSDGLNDMVEDEDIGSVLTMMAANLPKAADQLVQMANDNGGKDNVSVLLVKIKAPYPAKRGFWDRVKRWFI